MPANQAEQAPRSIMVHGAHIRASSTSNMQCRTAPEEIWVRAAQAVESLRSGLFENRQHVERAFWDAVWALLNNEPVCAPTPAPRRVQVRWLGTPRIMDLPTDIHEDTPPSIYAAAARDVERSCREVLYENEAAMQEYFWQRVRYRTEAADLRPVTAPVPSIAGASPAGTWVIRLDEGPEDLRHITSPVVFQRAMRNCLRYVTGNTTLRSFTNAFWDTVRMLTRTPDGELAFEQRRAEDAILDYCVGRLNTWASHVSLGERRVANYPVSEIVRYHIEGNDFETTLNAFSEGVSRGNAPTLEVPGMGAQPTEPSPWWTPDMVIPVAETPFIGSATRTGRISGSPLPRRTVDAPVAPVRYDEDGNPIRPRRRGIRNENNPGDRPESNRGRPRRTPEQTEAAIAEWRKITAILDSMGKSKRALARVLGVASSQVYRWMSGVVTANREVIEQVYEALAEWGYDPNPKSDQQELFS